MLTVSWPDVSYLPDEVRVTADDARRLVCADRPDAGGITDRRLRASPVCHAIRRGESAAQAARRTTGNGRNAYQAWFQIMNASSRFVPKSQYDRIHAGWRACVVPAIRSRSSNANHVEVREAANVSKTRNSSGVPRLLAAPSGTRERRRRRWRRR